MMPELEYNDNQTQSCATHGKIFPIWDSCPDCESEWLDNHDSMRTLQNVAKIAVLVSVVIGLVAFPLMAMLVQK